MFYLINKEGVLIRENVKKIALRRIVRKNYKDQGTRITEGATFKDSLKVKPVVAKKEAVKKIAKVIAKKVVKPVAKKVAAKTITKVAKK